MFPLNLMDMHTYRQTYIQTYWWTDISVYRVALLLKINIQYINVHIYIFIYGRYQYYDPLIYLPKYISCCLIIYLVNSLTILLSHFIFCYLIIFLIISLSILLSHYLSCCLISYLVVSLSILLSHYLSCCLIIYLPIYLHSYLHIRLPDRYHKLYQYWDLLYDCLGQICV